VNPNGAGIQLDSSSNITVHDNRAGNGSTGIGVGYSDRNSIYNNSVANNVNGIVIYISDQNSLLNNSAGNSSNAGVSIYDCDRLVVQGQYLSNNNPDMLVQNPSWGRAFPSTINLSGLVFDNPSGNMRNYTNLSINDTVNFGEAYTINWTANESATPYQSFAQKFVNITPLSGTPSIDSIIWSWTDAELSGYNESTFQLWSYDSTGWNLLNDTPDTVGDTLSFTNLNPQSDLCHTREQHPCHQCQQLPDHRLSRYVCTLGRRERCEPIYVG